VDTLADGLTILPAIPPRLITPPDLSPPPYNLGRAPSTSTQLARLLDSDASVPYPFLPLRSRINLQDGG
jgi:hypothetical protein